MLTVKQLNNSTAQLTSSEGEAAVAADNLSCYILGEVGGEEQSQLGNVFGQAGTTHGYPFLPFFDNLFGEFASHGSLYKARGYGVAAYVAAAQLLGH